MAIQALIGEEGLSQHQVAEQLGIGDAHELRTIEMGALLHDIGKIGVRDAVLLKPGPLDQDEWHEMREHPRLGWALLQRIDDITALYGDLSAAYQASKGNADIPLP